MNRGSLAMLRSVQQSVAARVKDAPRIEEEAQDGRASQRSEAQVGRGDDAMLVLGDQGPEVRKLITQLRKLGFLLKVGDNFDTTVRKCVEAFQVANVDASGQPLEVDGKVGPNTRWAVEAALGRRTLDVQTTVALPGVRSGGSNAGRRALAVAMREAEGRCGEKGSDNRGPDVRRYLNGKVPEGSSWCAGFVSYCFHEALGHDAAFGYLVGAQALHDRMRKLGHTYTAAMSNPPQPGDIIVWRRIDPAKPEKTKWQGHVGIVHSFTNGILWTIEGNRGPYPAIVRSFRYSWSDLVASLQGDRFKGLYGLSRHP